MYLVLNKGIAKHYQIFDKFEAGISLYGSEVKSIRSKQASLKGSYIKVEEGEIILVGMSVSKWRYSTSKLPKDRDRKLLLKRKEITRIQSKISRKGMTLIPLALYTSRNHIKVEIALAKGLRKFDIKSKEKELELLRKKESRDARNRKRNSY